MRSIDHNLSPKSEISEEELKIRNEKRKQAMESAKLRQLDNSTKIKKESEELEESPSKEELIATNKYEKYCQHRKKVYEEIISTEQTYVTSLQVAVNYYILPLRKFIGTNEEILSKEHIEKLFSNIEVIFNVNSVLLNQLSETQLNWDVEISTISNVFLQIIPYLKLYFEYESDYDTASEKLLIALKNERFKKLDDENAEKYLNNLTLNSILIMPIQRIPRYNLLLKDLIKHTWNDHPDYLKLRNTLIEIQKVGSNLNENLRLNEKMIKVQKIADEFKYPELVQPHRYFIKKIRMKLLKVDKKKRKFKEKKAYLFNDLILISSLRRKSSYEIVLMDFIWIKDYLSMYISTDDEYENGNVVQLPKIEKNDQENNTNNNNNNNNDGNNHNNHNNNHNHNHISIHSTINSLNNNNLSNNNNNIFYSVYEIWTSDLCYRVFNDSMDDKNIMINQIIHSINQLMNIRPMLEDQRFELFERLRGKIYDIPADLLPPSNPVDTILQSLHSPTAKENLNETYPYILLVGSQFEIISFGVRSRLEDPNADRSSNKVLSKFFGSDRTLTSGTSYHTVRTSAGKSRRVKIATSNNNNSNNNNNDDEDHHHDKGDKEDRSSTTPHKKEVISFKVGVLKEGEMTKQGFKVKNWKKRWFILEESILYYYRDNLAVKPKGSILLQHVEVYPSNHHHENGFVVATKGTKGREGREYHIYTTTSSDRDEWIAAISAQVKVSVVKSWCCEGWLYKKTKTWKKWRSRYFTLDTKSIHYYKDDEVVFSFFLNI